MKNWSTSKIFIVCLIVCTTLGIVVAVVTDSVVIVAVGIVAGLTAGYFLDKRNQRHSTGSWDL